MTGRRPSEGASADAPSAVAASAGTTTHAPALLGHGLADQGAQARHNIRGAVERPDDGAALAGRAGRPAGVAPMGAVRLGHEDPPQLTAPRAGTDRPASAPAAPVDLESGPDPEERSCPCRH